MMTTNDADPTVMETAGTPIGYRANGRPIHLHIGADLSVDDDDDSVDHDDSDDVYIDDDDDAEPEADTTDDDWSPPSRSDWDKLNERVKTNNRENAKLRGLKNLARSYGVDPTTDDGLAQLEELLRERSPGRQRSESSDAQKAERATARAAEQARAEAETTWKGRATRQAVIAELVQQGLDLSSDKSGSKISRALKLVDLTQVEFDADGNVIGASDEVAAVKREFPALFSAPAKPRRSGAADVDGGDKRSSGKPDGGWREKLNAQFGN